MDLENYKLTSLLLATLLAKQPSLAIFKNRFATHTRRHKLCITAMHDHRKVWNAINPTCSMWVITTEGFLGWRSAYSFGFAFRIALDNFLRKYAFLLIVFLLFDHQGLQLLVARLNWSQYSTCLWIYSICCLRFRISTITFSFWSIPLSSWTSLTNDFVSAWTLQRFFNCPCLSSSWESLGIMRLS